MKKKTFKKLSRKDWKEFDITKDDYIFLLKLCILYLKTGKEWEKTIKIVNKMAFWLI